MFEVPLLNISSSYIRESLMAGKSVRYLIPDSVRTEIENKGYYK
jgi:nicotinate-nucleotide adenylyltransferase